jgi:hypothetical protein
MEVIYENVFNRSLQSERDGLAIMQRRLRLRYEELLAEEGAPENTEKRQRAMDRVRASHLHDAYQRLCDELEAEEDRQDKLLNKLAPRVELKPHETMYQVGQVSVDAPRPPNTDSMAYLSPIKEMLEGHGFETYIRLGFGNQYELWANCPPWMVDAIDRRAP